MTNPACDRCGHPSAKHQGKTLATWSVCTVRLGGVDDYGAPLMCPCDGYFEPSGTIR